MNTTKKAEFDYEAYTRENAPDASQMGPEAHKRRREAFRARQHVRHAREMSTSLFPIAMRTRHVDRLPIP